MRNLLVKECPSKLHSIRSHAIELWDFEKPRPIRLWKLNTKCAVRFLPLPSSPCNTKGKALERFILPWDASSKTLCCGWSFSNFAQKEEQMASSLAASRSLNPCSMCRHEWCNKNSNQRRIFRMGMCSSDPKWLLSTRSDKPNLLINTRWQSLSGFFGLQRATCTKPPDLDATLSPTSDTKSRAAAMAETHEA